MVRSISLREIGVCCVSRWNGGKLKSIASQIKKAWTLASIHAFFIKRSGYTMIAVIDGSIPFKLLHILRFSNNPSTKGKLFRSFAHRDTQCLRNTLPIGWVGFKAIVDMTNLYIFGGVAHCTRSVIKKHLLLFRAHQPE